MSSANNLQRNLNTAMAAYANDIAKLSRMPNGRNKKILSNKLQLKLALIKNKEMLLAAAVLRNVYNASMRKRAAARKIQAGWAGYKSRRNERLKRGHSIQTPTTANRHYGRMARTRTLRANNN